MKKINKMNKNYVIASILSNHFFITKYLLYNLYNYTQEYSLFYIMLICMAILLLSPLIYKFTQKNFTKPKSSLTFYFLFIYLLISNIMSLVALTHFVNVHWLIFTHPAFIVALMLLLVFYASIKDVKALYKSFSLLFIIPVLTLLIYILSKYPYLHLIQLTRHFSFSNLSLGTIIFSLFIILEVFFIIFVPSVENTPLTKKKYYQYIAFMTGIILFEAIIENNEFYGILPYITFPFFESYNIIYFGQYIGYVNFPVLFIYIIGCFSKLALNTKVLQENLGHQKVPYLFFLMTFVFSVTLLLYSDSVIKYHLWFSLLALISLFLAIIFYNRKGEKINGKYAKSTKSLSK